jgi:hypothetical protein
MTINTVDNNRRDPTLFTSKVDQVLPEYFQDDNSVLVSFLEEYYKSLDSSSGTINFSEKIRDVYAARDISETDESFLDELIGEIGNGLKASAFFAQPRLMARLLGRFYQAKGTRNAAEGFFRGFFNEEVEIEYPKDQIFIVADSLIGYESQKFIIDNGIYQVLSILIRSGLSVSDYEDLYKKFVHPAGFHFAGEVRLTDEATFATSAQGLDPLAVLDVDKIVLSSATLDTNTLFGEHTGLQDSSDGVTMRIDFRQQELAYYTTDSDFTAQNMIDYYDDIKTLLNPNSFTLDDSANTARPLLSMTYETMDNDRFTRQSSDSSI